MEDERQMLLRIIEGQNALLQTQAEQIKALTEKIDALLKELEEKKHKKNSRNSSAPPSSDGYAKPTPKSQRKSSGAKPGGQDGHKGSSMKLMKAPDEIREHYPQACSGCPNREHCHGHIVERANGTVVATGSNQCGQCNVGGWTDIVAIDAGRYHTVGLRADGTIVTTGSDGYGQCGMEG